MRRILLFLLGLILLIFILGAGFGWYQARLGWPQTNGELRLSGLQAPVTVIRDGRGVPHIYASNTQDLFMAQGFVHAQDRFWQMEFWRRIGAGRLSELFGKSSLGQDRFLRTLGVTRSAELTLAQASPEARAVLEAYASGINAYIDQNRNKLPLEIRVLGLTGVKFQPEPWTPLHSLTWTTMMSFDLGGNYDQELDRAQLLARYGEGWMRELTMYDYPSDRPFILPDFVAWDQVDTESIARLPDGLILGQGEGIGSNNWVVAGSKSETGMPLLADDPHLSIQMPSIWYQNGLHCQPVGPACPFEVVGFSFASTPGVVIGHNGHIAWGVTNAYPDVQDLYIERINPANPNQYEVNGQWVEMEIIHDQIVVAGQKESTPLTIRRTRHGPILNDVAYGAESRWAFGWQPLALRWTALEGNRILEALIGLNLAQDWEDFRDALAFWDAPSQNFVYADTAGNIGYVMPGKMPLRPHSDGLTPVPGWTDDYEWQGYAPYEALPWAFNPPSGYIVTANNQVIDLTDYPYLTRHEGDTGDRAQRIVEMIEAKQKLSIADFQAIHGDNANLLARDLVPLLAGVPLDRTEVAAARNMLLAWDFQQDMDSPEAAFFEGFWHILPTALFGDELGDMAPRDRALIRLLAGDAGAAWWDNIHTPEKETREQILAQALNEGYDLVAERLGKDAAKWRWGALHTATFRNQTLGQSGIGPIESIFNRGPVETAGGSGIVNATGSSSSEDTLFELRSVPSLRIIMDLADLNRSLATHTTGQSGHPYHEHYDDQIENWRFIRYDPLLWAREQIEAAAADTLILTP